MSEAGAADDAPAREGIVRIGISGWRYEPWRGVFYPPDLPQRLELAYAARCFPTIEINGSFYSLQRPEYYAQWRAEAPPGFVFSVKGGRFITHMLKLRNVELAMANFFASGVANLQDMLGPFLWQLPPMLRFDPARLRDFFALLPRDTDAAAALARRRDAKVKGRARLAYGVNRPLRHCLEVRHESFCNPEFVALLREHHIGLVVADTAGKWPYADDVTADFVYVRLHGDEELYVSGYTPRALARWAERIRAWRCGDAPPQAQLLAPDSPMPRVPRDVYVYFDNDAKVKAPRDAQSLMRLLGLGWTPPALPGFAPPRPHVARARRSAR
ncbi:MAG TPA: DUF72 domain-containing protein [Casimicrobiaceae bacterium]|nr:DUF72 domain-containing protein [Casimicrobiaceae bacterium]